MFNKIKIGKRKLRILQKLIKKDLALEQAGEEILIAPITEPEAANHKVIMG